MPPYFLRVVKRGLKGIRAEGFRSLHWGFHSHVTRKKEAYLILFCLFLLFHRFSSFFLFPSFLDTTSHVLEGENYIKLHLFIYLCVYLFVITMCICIVKLICLPVSNIFSRFCLHVFTEVSQNYKYRKEAGNRMACLPGNTESLSGRTLVCISREGPWWLP